MVSIYQPSILALLETRMTNNKNFADELVIMYKDDTITINVISITSQVIHVAVKVSNSPSN